MARKEEQVRGAGKVLTEDKKVERGSLAVPHQPRFSSCPKVHRARFQPLPFGTAPKPHVLYGVQYNEPGHFNAFHREPDYALTPLSYLPLTYLS